MNVCFFFICSSLLDTEKQFVVCRERPAGTVCNTFKTVCGSTKRCHGRKHAVVHITRCIRRKISFRSAGKGIGQSVNAVLEPVNFST